MKRWLWLGVGMTLVGLASYLLATTLAPPANEEIDAASRAELERVLREAERP